MSSIYLETADRIGARLCRDALGSHGRYNWTADAFSDRGASHAALGPSLYAGTAGIALFLWQLWKATGERIFRVTAEGALRQALSKVSGAGPGFYSGGSGVLFAAAEMHGEFDEAAVVAQAEPDRTELDLISGSAGVIAVLLGLYHRTHGAALLERAVQHGELLLAEAARGEGGWSWRTLNRDRHLTGFSHGTSGIGWVSFELWRATGDLRFRQMGAEAFRYERTSFTETEQNWPDYRKSEPAYPVFWCHGAAGIGLARVRCWSFLRDPELLAEARIALATVRAHLGSFWNFSLCHGESGNADILLYAAEVLGEPEWLQAAEKLANDGVERFERRRAPWPCGIPHGNETPELMTGLAGVGLFYLRMADPAGTPTILLPGVQAER